MHHEPDNTAARVEDLLRQLTLAEKVSLLSGIDNWRTAPVERLGIPSLTMTDGPHGVRATIPEGSRKNSPATAFPTGSAMGATWNPALIERAAQAMAEETLALECDVLLGPCVNIIRTPLAGRNFETYSEDPYLAGQIGAAWVRGVQGQGVGASLKHYACNNQEIERFRSSSELDERTLREIYLPQFETIVKDTAPWTVMCSYNRINGEYASENYYLLTKILRDEWGFDGVVVSDWGANHTITDSIEGGLDLEMPGPAKYYGRLLVEAVRNWQIEAETVDAAVRRILRMIVRSGRMDAPRPAGSLNTPEHQALAREVAEEAITLLKNDGAVLPLDLAKVKTLAVIGPSAATLQVTGGGSSYAEPPYRVSPLQGLRELLGGRVTIRYEMGCDNMVEPPVLKAADVVPAADGSSGLVGEYFASQDFLGEPVRVQPEPKIDNRWWPGIGPAGLTKGFSARYTARYPAEGGTYLIKLQNIGAARVYLDGRLILENSVNRVSEMEGPSGAEVEQELAAGEHDLKIEFVRPADSSRGFIKFMIGRKVGQDGIDRAAALAAECDAALVFVGMPEGYESEGWDNRTDLTLPGLQDALVSAVVAANPQTAVILNAGAPVSLPWLDAAPAVVNQFYPGMEGGRAIARVLTGEVNPSGKLTSTFPVRLEDTPAYLNSCVPGARLVHYGEGIFVGYRHYEARHVAPRLPFGHGLSYTTFEYSDLHAPATAAIGEPVTVSVTVRNTGSRAGKETLQLYVSDLQASLPRPAKELKGFAKVDLAPDAAETVTFTLDRRAFAFYEPVQGEWVVEPGEFEILVGSSSADVRLAGILTLA